MIASLKATFRKRDADVISGRDGSLTGSMSGRTMSSFESF
jgi:hypothetical protein